jgi:hypothetical protein
MCTGGAIMNAANFGNARNGWGRALFEMNNRHGGSFVDWNNAPNRTAKEVVMSLREVASSAVNK